jgi:NADPH:quinone reductase-like Zn-dependent oxidoreductase
MGIEASGLVTKTGDRVSNLKVGDRVMLVIGGGSFATIIQTTDERCIKIPDELSLEEAATMPCVFSTAIYALINMARVEKSQVRHRSGVAVVEPEANPGAKTILIHSASGGLGQAAIQICQHVGATVCLVTFPSFPQGY